ncbi:MAG: pyridoxal-dependent decarboxylase [Patescibacteria group bacterium UBA2103]
MEAGVELKTGIDFREKQVDSETLKEKIVKDLPAEGISLKDIEREFLEDVLPSCGNFGTERFMGFPDSGNSVAGIGGALISDFLQQNLINQSFCAPSATFVEIAVLQWLREAVGYKNKKKIQSVWDVGGIVTLGGTLSNAVGMMLARERKAPGTIENGVRDPELFKVIVPQGIGHYSVKRNAALSSTPVTAYPRRESSTLCLPYPHGTSRILAPRSRSSVPSIKFTSLSTLRDRSSSYSRR